MQISKNHVVEMEYTLKDSAGKVLDASGGEPLAYLHGSRNIIPGLERELEGKKSGDALSVTVKPQDAYGTRDESLIRQVPKQELENSGLTELREGIQLQSHSPEGVRVFTITKVGDQDVTLDGNHPLAGMTLSFEIKIVNVRAATAEELAHGHVHGPGGHHH